MNASGENCSWRQYPTASCRIPLGNVAPWEMEVLLALLGAEHCVRLSADCFPCILSSETKRSDVCGVASPTLSRKHRDRSLEQRMAGCFPGDEAVLASGWLMGHLSPPAALVFPGE